MSVFDDIIESKNGEIIDNGWFKWIHSEMPDGPEQLRFVQQNLLFLLGHCMNCTALSGCYFKNSNRPGNLNDQELMHPHCHCLLKTIDFYKNEITAFCDINKINNYLFGENGLKNGKRRLFESWGFTVKDSNYIKEEFEKAAKLEYMYGKYKLGKLDRWGQRIDLKIILMCPDNKYRSITSGWLIHPLGYITCNTPVG